MSRAAVALIAAVALASGCASIKQSVGLATLAVGAGMIVGGAALCSGQDCSPSWGPHSEQSKHGTSLLIVGVPTVITSLVYLAIQGAAKPAEASPASSEATADAAQARSKQQAAAALARAGDCATVRTIANQVRSLDNDYYDRVFVLDPAIAACLGGAP